MENQSGTIELVYQLVKSLSGDPEAQSVRHSRRNSRPKSFNLAMGILGTSVRVSQIEDEGSVCDALKTFILASGDLPRATRFSELQIKLKTQVADSDLRTRVLMLLHMVGRDRRKSKSSEGGWWVGNEANLTLIHGGMDSNRGGGRMTPGPGDGINEGSTEWDLSTHVRSNQNKVIRHLGGSEVKEPLIVRDILYICQGIDGTYIKSKRNVVDGAETFSISSEAEVSPVTKKLILQLCELGWLFQKVQVFVESRSVHEGGSVRQAFCYAVNKELQDYFRLMAVLETQSVHPLPTAFRAQTDQGGVDVGDLKDGSGPYLSLRRLAVWLAEPMRRMRILAVLIDSTEKLSGGELAGGIYAHTRVGDPFAKEFVMRILRRVCVPLFEMIRAWVYEGELNDPHFECFIKEEKMKQNEDGSEIDMWRMGYGLNWQMLPEFVPGALADKILRAGKTINFLREYCGDVEWVQEQAAMAQATAEETMTYGNVETLHNLVEEASSLVDKRLIELLFKKFHFVLHCTAMKRFLLLGQGDFVQSLMDFIKPELDKEVGKVSEIQLLGHLRAAIHASSAKYDDDEVLDRLHARKGKAVGDHVGWDVFTLEYRMNQPLATVFTQKNMSSYLRIFRLLWKLKRAEHTLNHVWHSLKCMNRTLNQLPVGRSGQLARTLLRKALKIRSQLSHFCTNFQYYIMFEVLEGAWRSLTFQATQATDLDQLLQAHEMYLATIVTRCLLDEDTQTLRDTLEKMFDTCQKMVGVVNRLEIEISTVMNAYKAQVLSRKREMRGKRVSAKRLEAIPEMDIDSVPYGSVKDAIDSLGRTYEYSVGQFTKDLPPAAHVDLRFLIFRLDFAELYLRRDETPHEEDFDEAETFRSQ